MHYKFNIVKNEVMKLQFKCKLLTDVVLNMRSATSGRQNTLTFIPGSCFLGIVASSFKEFKKEHIQMLFDGLVKFGDAHVTIENEGENKQLTRSLFIPASMMYPKLKSITDECYIHYYYDRNVDHNGTNGGPMQLKQSRKGFYIFRDGIAKEVPIEISFAIKSAYDRKKRKAADEQMYGYESINKNTTFLFDVDIEETSIKETIIKALEGIKRIGRSRTAQYGLVEISKTNYEQPKSQRHGFEKDGKHFVSVYADGRLIFFDDNGSPTYRPTAKDFGIDGNICWEMSQVRTFQYSPYNFTRQAYDASRCCIEKGSVFVIETNTDAPINNEYVGNFCNEGFGKVIYNPDFLSIASNAQNGEAKYKFVKSLPTIAPIEKVNNIKDVSLINYLVSRKKERDAIVYIYEKVNEFVRNYKLLFSSDSFASQWGNIRTIAMRCENKDQLINELFDKTIIRHHYDTPTDPIEEDRYVEVAYLNHGIAMDKWKKGNRVGILRSFIEDISKEESKFNQDITLEAVINLASEMAKKCKKQ